MIENIVKDALVVGGIYSTVSFLGYLDCVRQSIRELPMLNHQDPLRFGLEKFRYIFPTSYFQSIPTTFIVLYYTLKLAQQ